MLCNVRAAYMLCNVQTRDFYSYLPKLTPSDGAFVLKRDVVCMNEAAAVALSFCWVRSVGQVGLYVGSPAIGCVRDVFAVRRVGDWGRVVCSVGYTVRCRWLPTCCALGFVSGLHRMVLWMAGGVRTQV